MCIKQKKKDAAVFHAHATLTGRDSLSPKLPRNYDALIDDRGLRLKFNNALGLVRNIKRDSRQLLKRVEAAARFERQERKKREHASTKRVAVYSLTTFVALVIIALILKP